MKKIKVTIICQDFYWISWWWLWSNMKMINLVKSTRNGKIIGKKWFFDFWTKSNRVVILNTNLTNLCTERGSKWYTQHGGLAHEGHNSPFALPRSRLPVSLLTSWSNDIQIGSHFFDIHYRNKCLTQKYSTPHPLFTYIWSSPLLDLKKI